MELATIIRAFREQSADSLEALRTLFKLINAEKSGYISSSPLQRLTDNLLQADNLALVLEEITTYLNSNSDIDPELKRVLFAFSAMHTAIEFSIPDEVLQTATAEVLDCKYADLPRLRRCMDMLPCLDVEDRQKILDVFLEQAVLVRENGIELIAELIFSRLTTEEQRQLTDKAIDSILKYGDYIKLTDISSYLTNEQRAYVCKKILEEPSKNISVAKLEAIANLLKNIFSEHFNNLRMFSFSMKTNLDSDDYSWFLQLEQLQQILFSPYYNLIDQFVKTCHGYLNTYTTRFSMTVIECFQQVWPLLPLKMKQEHFAYFKQDFNRAMKNGYWFLFELTCHLCIELNDVEFVATVESYLTSMPLEFMNLHRKTLLLFIQKMDLPPESDLVQAFLTKFDREMYESYIADAVVIQLMAQGKITEDKCLQARSRIFWDAKVSIPFNSFLVTAFRELVASPYLSDQTKSDVCTQVLAIVTSSKEGDTRTNQLGRMLVIIANLIDFLTEDQKIHFIDLSLPLLDQHLAHEAAGNFIHRAYPTLDDAVVQAKGVIWVRRISTFDESFLVRDSVIRVVTLLMSRLNPVEVEDSIGTVIKKIKQYQYNKYQLPCAVANWVPYLSEEQKLDALTTLLQRMNQPSLEEYMIFPLRNTILKLAESALSLCVAALTYFKYEEIINLIQCWRTASECFEIYKQQIAELKVEIAQPPKAFSDLFAGHQNYQGGWEELVPTLGAQPA